MLFGIASSFHLVLFHLPTLPITQKSHSLPMCLLSEIKLARLYASVAHKDVLMDGLCGLMNKQLLPPHTSVHLSLSDSN